MATKAIKNMVDLINQKYAFRDDGGELRIAAQRTFKGWQIALVRVNDGGAWIVVLTQHQEVSAGTALLILQMLFHDILERQSCGHYKITKKA